MTSNDRSKKRKTNNINKAFKLLIDEKECETNSFYAESRL